MKPSHYEVEVSAAGFQLFAATGMILTARQELRIDVRPQVGQSSTSLNVEGTAGVITTDTQTIQSSLNAESLLNLPANIR
jgi:hypothetical protein